VVQFPLELTLAPQHVLAPVQGSSAAEDTAVRDFCIAVWEASADEPTRYQDFDDPAHVLRGSLTIGEAHMRAFCETVHNQSWPFAFADDGRLRAPADVMYLPAIRSILEVLQSTVFGSGQVNVVHLYNRMRLADGAPMLAVGDTVTSALRITGLVNLGPGKRVATASEFRCNGRLVGTIESAFLSRAHYVDAARAFEYDRGRTIAIALPTPADVAVLESREWFVYRADAPLRITPGVEVEFCLDSAYRFASDDVYSSIATTGTVSLRTRGNGHSVAIADVDFAWGAAPRNPVLEYLNRHRVASDDCLFDNDGYALTTAANAGLARAAVPATNWDYARHSFDCNPFHVNPYVADFADLPEPITHGLWTSASTRAIVEAIAAGGHPERVRAYNVTFTGMVFPTNTLTTELRHVGMKDGRMLVAGRTSKVDGGGGGGPVMDITAEVDQPRTAYVFTGQGSQEAGMGMALYELSAVARNIWDRANKHMLETYDLDLLDIVRTNPTECTVYFYGDDGERIRANYMALSRRMPDKTAAAGYVLAPIIPEITALSRSHTFRLATGLLNATQFTQTALILVAMAAVADMRAHGLVQRDAMFAGHSLGEYCALAAMADIFTLEGLLDITFYRGLVMQSAVPRDALGRSDFGMVAVDPSRVGSGWFGEDQLHVVVDAICAASPGLLQIVNYNVRGSQYVASGTLANLAALRLVLDVLAGSGVPSSGDVSTHVAEIVARVLAAPVGTEAVRGRATIPLRGIDVPFHSQQLMDGVPEFRAALRTKINTDTVSPALLHRRYIPNLTAVPFEVSRESYERVLDTTGSPVARSVLDGWNDEDLEDPVQHKRLAVDLLVELLTYQLAAPVQWIRTQDRLIAEAEIQRLVEVGPAPVLCGMAAKTLARAEFDGRSVALLHFERDQDELYYRNIVDEPEPAAPEAPQAAEPAPVEKPPVEQQQQQQQSAAPAAAPVAGTGESIADVPLQAVDVVHAIVTYKMQRPLAAIPAQQTVKALVGGKSTLQNEIVGDLQKEFGNKLPDKSEDAPLQDLGAAIGSCGGLGKCTQPLVARLFSSKMPGGFSLTAARTALQSAYGLGPQRQDALLLVALTMEPAARLASEADARAWLNDVAKAYAARAGISYATAAGTATGGAAAQGPVVSSAEVAKMQQAQREH
ncbi:fatty acid synthase alpha subunit Lsd1, partial [Coemansia helicoidea]